MEPIISVSGMRGIVGESLTLDVAIRYVALFAEPLPPGPIVVTQDGRTTGPMLFRSIAASLEAVGRTVLDGGVAATPTTGVLVRQHTATGGIQISASHNPPEFNGLKLFSAEGRVIGAHEGARLVDRYRTAEPRWVRHDGVGHVRSLDDTVGRHAEHVLATVDVDRIRSCRFKVFLDANHGAGSLVGRHLLSRLGCHVSLVGGEPDGRFAHPAEPTADHLAGVLSSVRNAGVDVGFCQDPDADRLAVIDAEGHYLGEEYTIAMCVDHLLRTRGGPVVTNCSTSRMVEDVARKAGVPFFRSAVGEANVVDSMLAHDAVLGGEGNGGVIDPRVGLVRDSFVGMALLLDAMAATGSSVAGMAACLPRYAIHKTTVVLPGDQLSAGLARLEAHFHDAAADRLDGLRLDWSDRWLLLRGSNTEPIVRLVAEAESADDARALCDQATGLLVAP